MEESLLGYSSREAHNNEDGTAGDCQSRKLADDNALAHQQMSYLETGQGYRLSKSKAPCLQIPQPPQTEALIRNKESKHLGTWWGHSHSITQLRTQSCSLSVLARCVRDRDGVAEVKVREVNPGIKASSHQSRKGKEMLSLVATDLEVRLEILTPRT